MKPIKAGNRVIVIADTAPASKNAPYRNPIEQRARTRRIVVLRNGKSVGRRRGR
jgi:hypothetical protein